MSAHVASVGDAQARGTRGRRSACARLLPPACRQVHQRQFPQASAERQRGDHAGDDERVRTRRHAVVDVPPVATGQDAAERVEGQLHRHGAAEQPDRPARGVNLEAEPGAEERREHPGQERRERQGDRCGDHLDDVDRRDRPAQASTSPVDTELGDVTVDRAIPRRPARGRSSSPSTSRSPRRRARPGRAADRSVVASGSRPR